MSALLGVVAVFEKLGVRYLLGGSLASSLHGVARYTNDFDFSALLLPAHAREFVALTSGAYYVDEEAVMEAIRRGASFNLIHQGTFDKVDIFTKNGAWERREHQRAVRVPLTEAGIEVVVSSPEDIVLRKLDWYRQGGGVSDRQWGDVLGVLKLQGEHFDRAYATEQAAELGVQDLLARALDEAGIV